MPVREYSTPIPISIPVLISMVRVLFDIGKGVCIATMVYHPANNENCGFVRGLKIILAER
jgi:hypothetical protein